MRDILYGAMVVLIAWAVIDQWRRNKDTVKTIILCLVIGAAVLIVLLMVWKKATTGHL